MRCQHCKSTENLNRIAVGKTGIVSYLCRKCNLAKMKNYYKTEAGKLAVKKSNYKSIKKFKNKQNARVLLNQAVKKGKVIKPVSCQNCDLVVKRLEAHHPNYCKPLEVDWLCSSCHAIKHR